jgi:hypothetical protein
MEQFKITYRWKEDNNAMNEMWNTHFVFVTAKTESDAIEVFSSDFIPSISFQIISINGVLTNAEKQRRYLKNKEEEENRRLFKTYEQRLLIN